MKPLFCLMLLTLASVVQAATYECTDRQGRRTYTNTSVAGQNCRSIDLGRPSLYSSAAPTTPSTNPTPNPVPAAPTTLNPESQAQIAVQAEISAAENRLQQARQNLEQGRQVRYGNERNYARYLERIKGLEDEVSQAQDALNHLKQTTP